MNFEYEWVEDNERLVALCQQWSDLDSLILDTEFVRTTTFYPAAGLIQVAAAGKFYLLDPVAIKDMSAFGQLLTNPEVVKVLHSCSEDLEVFKRLLNVVPSPLFDTQLAGSYASVGHNLSYQRLIKALLDVDVPKDETRSNWLKRPLTQSQLDYACLDVVYLEKAYQLLVDKLTQQQRLSWLEEDCLAMVEKALVPVDATEMYKKVKLAWKLKPSALVVLQAVTAWREDKAMQQNQPRSHVVGDKALWDIAYHQPKTTEALSRSEGIKSSVVRKHGESILQVVQQAQQTPPNEMPQTLSKPLSSRAGDIMKAMKRELRVISEQLDLAPEHLARKKDLESLLRSGYPKGTFELPQALCGWRRELVGEPLLQFLTTNEVS